MNSSHSCGGGGGGLNIFYWPNLDPRLDSDIGFLSMHFAGGPMMAHLKWYFDPSSPHRTKKKSCQSWTPLTKLSGSAHAFNLQTTKKSMKYFSPGNELGNKSL